MAESGGGGVARSHNETNKGARRDARVNHVGPRGVGMGDISRVYLLHVNIHSL